MKIKGDHKLDTAIFVVGIVLTDAVIYLLLELLLQGYTYDHGLGSGSKNQDEVSDIAKMINVAIYIWLALNLITIIFLIYRMLMTGSQNRIKGSRVSSKS